MALSKLLKQLLGAADDIVPNKPRPKPEAAAPAAPKLPEAPAKPDQPPVDPGGGDVPTVPDTTQPPAAPGSSGEPRDFLRIDPPPKAPTGPVRSSEPPLSPEDIKATGKLPGDAATVDRFGPAPTARGIDELEGKPPERAFNWAKFDTGDDVKLVISDTFKAIEAQADHYRRGKVSFEEIDEAVAARMLDTSPQKILELKTASAEDIQEAFAVQTALAQDLKEVAARALDPEKGTDDDLIQMRMIQEQLAIVTMHVKGLQTETARALSSMRMMRQARAEQGQMLAEVMTRMGGIDNNRELARIIDELDPAAATAMAIKSRKATRFEMIMEAYTQTLLTNPATHMVNFGTSALNVAWRNLDWHAAYMVNRLRTMFRGDQAERIYGREVLSMWVDTAAWMRVFSNLGAGDAKAAGRALAQTPMVSGAGAGIKAFWRNEPGDLVNKFDSGFKPAISSENVGALPEVQLLGRLLGEDEFGKKMWGEAFDWAADVTVRLPGRVMMGADETVKLWAYMNEMRRIAWHEGIEKGLNGKALRDWVSAALSNPEDMLPGASQAAWAAAREVAFQQPLKPGGIAHRLQQLIYGRSTLTAARQDPNLGMAAQGALAVGDFVGSAGQMFVRWHFPFWKTPVNLFAFAVEHSPMAALTKKFYVDVFKEGGVAADMAIARILTGTTFSVGVYEWLLSGLITGGGPQDYRRRQTLERTGWRPYSILIRADSLVGALLGLKKDEYISYRRADPFSMLIGLYADYHDLTAYMTEEEREEGFAVVTGIVLSVSRNLMSKTWMTGATKLAAGMQELLQERNMGAIERILLDMPQGFLAPPGVQWLIALFEGDVPRRDSRSADAARRKTLAKVDPSILQEVEELKKELDGVMSQGITGDLVEYYEKMMAKVRARTRSKEQPPLLDFWGNEVHYDPGFMLGILPFYRSEAKFDHGKLKELGMDLRGQWTGTRVTQWPREKYLKFISAVGIDGEMIRLGKPLPNWRRSIQQVELTPWEYHRVVKLTNTWTPGEGGVLTFSTDDAGESQQVFLEFDGLTMRQAMEKLIRQPWYQAAPDLDGQHGVTADGNPIHSKYEMLKRIASFYRRGQGHRIADEAMADAREQVVLDEKGPKIGGAELLFLRPKDGGDIDEGARDWFGRWKAWQLEKRRRAGAEQ